LVTLRLSSTGLSMALVINIYRVIWMNSVTASIEEALELRFSPGCSAL